MDHFSYSQQSQPNTLPPTAAHHHQQQQQQQPLTPISNITNSHNHASYHHNDSPAQSTILPPLHSQPNGQHFGYQPSSTYKSSQQHQEPHQYGSNTSRIPHTPDTPSSVEGSTTTLPHLAPQPPMNVAEPQVSSYAAASHASQDTSPNGYHASSQPASGFSMPSVPHYSQAPAQSHINPATNGMYDRNYSQHSTYSYGAHPQSESSSSQGDARPMPVVGSQGRRGILPSVGAAPPARGSAPDGSLRGVTGQPSKNSENKYPCNFCNKTYLHLKHLKRHHLRHTGERPYQCGLCHETFCRSDILKRHFNKCAIRRGNPTGANHLTHAQAHLNKPPRSAPNSSNGSTAPPPLNALTSISTNQPPSSYQQGPWSATTARSSATATMDQNHLPMGDSTRTSRSSSLIGPDPQADEERKRFSTGASLAPMNGNYESTSTSATSHERPFSYPFGADRQMPAYRDSNGTSGYPYQASMPPPQEQQLPSIPGYMRPTHGWPTQYNHGSASDGNPSWSQYFNANGQDSVMYNGHH